jgi:hypothetical protein
MSQSKTEYFFTCKDCGSHDLQVVHEYTIISYHTETLPCDCGNTSDGIAALRSSHVATTYRDWGWLDDEHRWEKEESEKIEDDVEYDEAEVFCQKCYQKAEEQDWEPAEEESEEVEEDEDSTEFYVYCDGCDREIEFGWSHPNREGRIWPAECIDFNPWKSWPEPRYRETWAKKNWLRPD